MFQLKRLPGSGTLVDRCYNKLAMDINGSACNYTDNAACKDVSCNAPISPSHQATGRQVLQFLNDAKNNVTFLESCSSKVQQLLNNLPCYDEKTTGELVDWFQVIDVLRELYSREGQH